MSISGNLNTMPFADLLQWVTHSRKTGTLVVQGESYIKKIYFQMGLVAAVASNNPKEFLGYYLVGWGYVGDEELQELLDMQEKHRTMLGELLVMIGRMAREELDLVLQLKTEESIYDLFLWEHGAFEFLENVLPEKKFEPLDMPVDMIIMEGVRRQDEWQTYSQVIPDATHVAKVVKAVDVSQMGPAELAIFKEMTGSASLEEIALGSHTSVFSVIEYIYSGVTQGLFEIGSPRPEPAPIPGFAQGMWRTMIAKAEQALASGDLLTAHRHLTAAKEKFTTRRDVLELAGKMEAKIIGDISEDVLDDNVVFELAVTLADLSKHPISPEEGFLLSRINGNYSIGEVLIMVPGQDFDKRLMIHHLLRRQVIRIKDEGTENKDEGQKDKDEG